MKSNLHWKYFLALDEDFGQLSRFIEPCRENLDSYSLEMARMLMAATQECDVVLKELCRISGNSDCKNEHEYREYLNDLFPSISGIKISCPYFQLEFIPFSSWESNSTPNWWSANNKVKHHRNQHYSQACLKNVMEAISGLLVLDIFLLKDAKNNILLDPDPKYFKPELASCDKFCIMHSEYIVPV
jgi:hypothetical protein